MQIYSAFMFAGIFTTMLIPETKRKTLEELAGEYEMGDEHITGGTVMNETTVTSGSGSDSISKSK